jgi:phage terminase small subunit
MPRKSAASLSVIPLETRSNRLCPPASLSESERAVFVDVITSCKANHFQQSDLSLLCRYAELSVLAEQAAGHLKTEGPVIAGRVNPWLVVQEKAVRGLVALSMRLRLSPQARQPNNPSRAAPVSHYDKMRLDHDGSD